MNGDDTTEEMKKLGFSLSLSPSVIRGAKERKRGKNSFSPPSRHRAVVERQLRAALRAVRQCENADALVEARSERLFDVDELREEREKKEKRKEERERDDEVEVEVEKKRKEGKKTKKQLTKLSFFSRSRRRSTTLEKRSFDPTL